MPGCAQKDDFPSCTPFFHSTHRFSSLCSTPVSLCNSLCLQDELGVGCVRALLSDVSVYISFCQLSWRDKASTAGYETSEKEELQVLEELSLSLPSYNSEDVIFSFFLSLSFNFFFLKTTFLAPCLCEGFFQH